jgi:AAA ATPase domain
VRFVGREDDLSHLEGLLAPDAPARVVFVHGPGGIGKSALLRELGRRAEERGERVLRFDGRDRDRAQERFDEALAAARTGRCLLLLDTYEQASAIGAQLRRELDPGSGAGARLVIAGRKRPEPAWHEDGWEDALLTLRLAPLDAADSRALIGARGVVDEEAAERIAAWGDGSPLAMAVAADALLAGNKLDLERLDADQLLASTLVGRLAGSELDGADREIVAVAAIAHAVDAALLAAVLPGVDGDHAEAWLRSLSFSEELGTRVTLHERVRQAVGTALAAQEPEHERELRRRAVDHLFERAALGELRLIVDICELITNPTVRWGISPPPIGYRADRLLPGDAERLAEMLGAEGTDWWRGARRWLEEAPEHVIVVRDAAGEIAGWRVWVTPASAPDWVGEDTVIAPWLADARARAPEGDVLLLRDGSDLVRERDSANTSPVVAVANFASVIGCGLPSVRYMYATTDPEDRQVHEFLLALGYERVPENDVEDGERVVPSYVVDWGPGGVVRALRDIVYRDMGMSPPRSVERQESAADTVRDALRAYRDPIALAASPLGRGRGTEERAATVRELLREAVAAAFGDSPDQRLQRQAIERGYLDPEGGHARAMHELSVSRTTYFRRLAEGSERVTRYVLETRA